MLCACQEDWLVADSSADHAAAGARMIAKNHITQSVRYRFIWPRVLETPDTSLSHEHARNEHEFPRFAGKRAERRRRGLVVETLRTFCFKRQGSGLCQFARTGRFSARANTRAAVWDKPRSGSDAPALVSRPTLGKYMWVTHPPNPFHGRLGRGTEFCPTPLVDATKAGGNEETCLLVLKRRRVAALQKTRRAL